MVTEYRATLLSVKHTGTPVLAMRGAEGFSLRFVLLDGASPSRIVDIEVPVVKVAFDGITECRASEYSQKIRGRKLSSLTLYQIMDERPDGFLTVGIPKFYRTSAIIRLGVEELIGTTTKGDQLITSDLMEIVSVTSRLVGIVPCGVSVGAQDKVLMNQAVVSYDFSKVTELNETEVTSVDSVESVESVVSEPSTETLLTVGV